MDLKSMTPNPTSTIPQVCRTLLLVAVLISVGAAAANELQAVAGLTRAEEFSLIDIDGRKHYLSDYRDKVVLVSFWASWCRECVYEMPSIEALVKKMPADRFHILAVSVGETRERIAAFARDNQLSFSILLDQEMEVYKRWPVLGVPTSFIIDRNGSIAYSAVGAVEWDSEQTQVKIRALLTPEPTPVD